MSEEFKKILKEKRFYNVFFDFVTLSSNDDPDEDYYDEIIYYDGGGVEGYGNSEKT